MAFENITKFLIDGAANGFNSTDFAFGAIGEGKTYTMLENDNNQGTMPFTLRDIYPQSSFLNL